MPRSHSLSEERRRKVRSSRLYQTFANNQFDQGDTSDEDDYILSSNVEILPTKHNESATQENAPTATNLINLDGEDSIKVEVLPTVPVEEIISKNVNNGQSTISSSSEISVEENVQTPKLYENDIYDVSSSSITPRQDFFAIENVRSISVINESLESVDISSTNSMNAHVITDGEQSIGLRATFVDDEILAARLRGIIVEGSLYEDVTDDEFDYEFYEFEDDSDYLSDDEQRACIDLNILPRSNNSDCSICLDDGITCILPCSHHFHETCLQKWFETKNTCPLCRTIH